VKRRYTRVKKGEGPIPDLVLIDGGKGQLTAARQALEDLQFGEITLLGVAKGAGRKPGREKLYLAGGSRPILLPPDSPAMHLVQQIRNEAHRFAITGHRQRRGRARKTSFLESIPGLGPQRRRELLRQFGGLQGVSRAGVDDLVKVRGISRVLAERIYGRFHNETDTLGKTGF
jgi:excinuclease ABC subunit C